MAAAAALGCGLKAWVLCLLALLPPPATAALQVLIIEGLGGEPQYQQQFDADVRSIEQAARTLTPAEDVHALTGAAATRAAVQASFHSLSMQLTASDSLMVYLIGHGSYDGVDYKFNLPGPDVSARELAALLDAVPAQQQLVVACGSASGALLEPLKRAHRTVITATRSGNEKNVTRFDAEYDAALGATAADSNKDGAITAREAFDYASRRVQDYFEHQALLASEHGVLQGDGADIIVARLNAPALTSAVPAASTLPPDSPLLQRRTELNARIEALRARKAELPPDQYQQQLQDLLVQLALTQRQIDQAGNAEPAHAP